MNKVYCTISDKRGLFDQAVYFSQLCKNFVSMEPPTPCNAVIVLEFTCYHADNGEDLARCVLLIPWIYASFQITSHRKARYRLF
jgi:hypothetical protein